MPIVYFFYRMKLLNGKEVSTTVDRLERFELWLNYPFCQNHHPRLPESSRFQRPFLLRVCIVQCPLRQLCVESRTMHSVMRSINWRWIPSDPLTTKRALTAKFIRMEFISIIKTPNIDKAILVQSDAVTLEGTLCITTHYLLFSSRKNPDDEVWVGYRFGWLTKSISRDQSIL